MAPYLSLSLVVGGDKLMSGNKGYIGRELICHSLLDRSHFFKLFPPFLTFVEISSHAYLPNEKWKAGTKKSIQVINKMNKIFLVLASEIVSNEI
jgi:hypothetical protein